MTRFAFPQRRPCIICRILYGHEGPRCLVDSARTLGVDFDEYVLQGRLLGIIPSERVPERPVVLEPPPDPE